MSVVKLLEAEHTETRKRLKIEDFMAAHNMNMAEFKRKIGYTGGALYKAMRGEIRPRPLTLRKIATAFGMSYAQADDLFNSAEQDGYEQVIDPRKAPDVFMGRPHPPAPQEVASYPSNGLSVQLNTLDDGRVHLMLSLDRVMPLAEALTLLRCLDGGEDE